MPYKDKEVQKRHCRSQRRKWQHGNWRQIYYDNDGMCQICGGVEHLEFHAPQRECNGTHRILVCYECHKHHDENYPMKIDHSYELSMLHEDVEAEMAECGGLEQWKTKCGIVEKEL
jgi:hypothetical protein